MIYRHANVLASIAAFACVAAFTYVAAFAYVAAFTYVALTDIRVNLFTVCATWLLKPRAHPILASMVIYVVIHRRRTNLRFSKKLKSLVLGGVKSGKSRQAQNLAVQCSLPVTFIATALAQDSQMSERIARHKEDRPANWVVVEEPYRLGAAIEKADQSLGCVLVDCLTLWLTQLLVKEDASLLEKEKRSLLKAIMNAQGELIIVSNENNMGIMPLGELSRIYCDEIGLLHQQIAELCDLVLLSVAGLPMTLKGDMPAPNR